MRFNVKKTAAGTAMAGALGLSALGLGAGISQADPPVPPVPPVPGIPGPVIPGVPSIGDWLPSMPPGQNPFGPPGQVMKMPTLNVGDATIPNPFYGVPPGHWDDLNYLDPERLTWMPPGYDLTAPLNLVWNAATSQWGVFVDDTTFVPFPIQLPAPPPAT